MSSSSGTVIDSPIIEVFVAIVLGALAGLIVGFVICGVLRYCSILLGRHIGGGVWVLYASLLGALVFGLLSAFRDE